MNPEHQQAQLRDSIMEMGFERDRAEKAMKATDFVGLTEALEWLIAHQDELDAQEDDSKSSPIQIIHESIKQTSSSGASNTVSENTTTAINAENGASGPKTSEHSTSLIPNSYKCDECGRLLKNEQELEFHAGKTNHSQFSETTEMVKQLTEEERKERTRKLQEHLKLKRQQKEEEERKKAVDFEKERRKVGQEMQAAKERIEAEEMKKIVEDRKRQKIADTLAKKKILEEIQQDKLARKQANNPGAADSKPEPSKVEIAPPVPPINYEECKIQIRQLNGQILNQTFKSKEPLSAVRLFAELHRTDNTTDQFNFMTTYPRRVFNDEEDMEAPLERLGLVPSSVLVMVRKPIVQ